MLENARVATRLPSPGSGARQAVVLEKLGLEPAEERPGGLLYRFSNGEFALYGSGGASPGTFTQMGFEVDDLEAVVTELKRRGVEFEEVDIPGLETTDGIAEVEGNYPSKGGKGERAAWFRDCEGNMLGLGQPLT